MRIRALPHDVICHVCGFCDYRATANAYTARVVELAWLPNPFDIFMWACDFGSTRVVKQMLQDGLQPGSPDEENPYSTDPLARVVLCGSSDILQLLLDAGCVPTSTAAVNAAVRGYIEVVRAYMERAPNYDLKKMEAVLVGALYNGHSDIARLIKTKRRGVDMDPYRCRHVFSQAVENGYLDVVDFCIEQEGFMVHPHPGLFHCACNKGGHTRIIDLFLDAGIQPINANLLVAIQRGQCDIVQRFLGIMGTDGDYPLMMAHAVGGIHAKILGLLIEKEMPRQRFCTRLLHRACQRGLTAIVGVLLEKCGAILNNVIVERALGLAKRCKQSEVVSALEKHLPL